MTTHESRLQGREEIAKRTMAFHFEKPAGGIDDDIRSEDFYGC